MNNLYSDKKSYFDFSLFFTAILLWGIGVALIYSATAVRTSGGLAAMARSQIVWVVLGLLVIIVIVSVPLRLYYGFAYVLYGISLLLLVYAVARGVVLKGAGRWISIGPLRMQPSEFAKIGLLLALARYFTKRTLSLSHIRSFVVPGIMILLPFALVLQQPDLGTAMIFAVMALPLFYWAGLSLLDLFFLISPGISLALSLIPLIIAFGRDAAPGISGAIPWGIFFVVVCVVLYLSRPRLIILAGVITINLFTAGATNVFWNSLLQDYQKKRIVSFINPQEDPYGAGYQVIQSKVAIGSGHLFGKGYLNGTQTRLSFLPEQHTDFIFSVLGEQFGLVGCTVVLLLFLFIIVRGLLMTQVVRSRFTNLLVVGAVSIIAFHVFINVAITVGIMPVTGLPLPFLSYGGSFTLTVAVLIGFLLNARLGRQEV